MEGVGLLILLAGIVLGSDQVYKKPEIYSMVIHTDIKYRFATTKVTCRVKNPSASLREALFDVTLPNEAFITNLTLDIDGKIVLGEVKEKEAAKQQYKEAQQRGESAGYIGTKERETNRFTLSVSVAPEAKVSFNLTYQELLKRTHGYYEEMIYIDPGMPIPELDVTVAILESREITQLSVPVQSNLVDGELLGGSVAVISQTSPTIAIVKYAPTLAQQTTDRDSGLSGRLVVRYDVNRSMDAGDVMMVNGYFVHFFAPEGFEPIPNDVLFILDKSGSMADRKMEQLKEAMLTILKDMHEGDRINIMAFSSQAKLWKDHMVDIFDEDIRAETEAYIRGIRASGMTDIEEAIRDGLEFMSELPEDEGGPRSRVIVFLTDGEATSGITGTDDILKRVKKANMEANIPLFTLAFGEGADYDLSKRLAAQNNGFGRKIYEASDASMQIAGFYSEIAVTLLNDIQFNYLDVKEVTRTHFTNYFNGSEIIICGLYEDYLRTSNETEKSTEAVARNLNVRVESLSNNGPSVLLVTDEIDAEQDDFENLTKAGDYEQITEKVWAYLTIKQLLEKELASDNTTEKDDINARILDISLKYSFVTPLTSMVVTLPNVTMPSVEGHEDEDMSPDVAYADYFYSAGPMDYGLPGLPPPMPSSYQHSYQLPVPSRRSSVGGKPSQPPKVIGKSVHTKKSKKTQGRKKSRRPIKNKKTPLPLTIRTTATTQQFCFRLPSLHSQADKAYLLFSVKGFQIQATVSSNSTSVDTGLVTEVRVYENGTLAKSLTNKSNSKHTKIDMPSSINCSISVAYKSRRHGLIVNAECGSDVTSDGGIIDSFVSQTIQATGKGSKKKKRNKNNFITIGSDNYRLKKHKARGQKCYEFNPKEFFKMADFLI